ncbi:helix-turn-helix domain-containing protein [Pontibacter rugosus]|uniref:Helix-turn-helix domain-containing protein n=1 Tax=Pontibacter rugosus TaxID=1745966 RepID=A0ABW3SUT5_9BACT
MSYVDFALSPEMVSIAFVLYLHQFNENAVTLAEKIVIDRKSKGFSQEELAERAKVSLRTIQRIEKGESEPRGFTLQAIAGALGKSVDEFVVFATEQAVSAKTEATTTAAVTAQNDAATYLQLINLSALSYLVLPYLNLIIPIVLWRKKRHELDIDAVSKKIINFQLLWTVALHVSLLLMLLFQLLLAYYFQMEPGPGILIVFFIMYLLNAPVIMAASLKLKKGRTDIYPFGLNIF